MFIFILFCVFYRFIYIALCVLYYFIYIVLYVIVLLSFRLSLLTLPSSTPDVDCGRVPPMTRGEVFYLNESTFLGSHLTYTCNQNYKLIGDGHRVCERDSRWSGEAPKCEGKAVGKSC